MPAQIGWLQNGFAAALRLQGPADPKVLRGALIAAAQQLHVAAATSGVAPSKELPTAVAATLCAHEPLAAAGLTAEHHWQPSLCSRV